jgi:hypothetical protein
MGLSMPGIVLVSQAKPQRIKAEETDVLNRFA